MKRTIVLGLVGGALITLLKVVEYRHFAHMYPTELYVGLIVTLVSAGILRKTPARSGTATTTIAT